MATLNKFLLKQRGIREAAAEEHARAAVTAAQRREFDELCPARRTGCIRRVDLGDAVDIVLRAGPASGSITLVPLSAEVRFTPSRKVVARLA